MSLFKGLHHFNVVVSDLETSKEFYSQILNLELILETEVDDSEFSRGVDLQGSRVKAAFFRLPNNDGIIELFQFLKPRGRALRKDQKPNDRGWGHLGFEVEDIETSYRLLSDQGVRFMSPPVTIGPRHPHSAGVRFCYFFGPDRELIEILQVPSD